MRRMFVIVLALLILDPLSRPTGAEAQDKTSNATSRLPSDQEWSKTAAALIALSQSREEMARDLKPAHPQLVALQRQIASLQSDLDQLPPSVLAMALAKQEQRIMAMSDEMKEMSRRLHAITKRLSALDEKKQ